MSEGSQEVTTKHYFGDKKNMSYNSRTKRVCPADWPFILITLFLILTPSLLCLVVVIIMNDKFSIELKVFLVIIYVTSLAVCLWSLYYCSSTEPGIIPSLTVGNTLPDTR